MKGHHSGATYFQRLRPVLGSADFNREPHARYKAPPSSEKAAERNLSMARWRWFVTRSSILQTTCWSFQTTTCMFVSAVAIKPFGPKTISRTGCSWAVRDWIGAISVVTIFKPFLYL